MYMPLLLHTAEFRDIFYKTGTLSQFAFYTVWLQIAERFQHAC